MIIIVYDRVHFNSAGGMALISSCSSQPGNKEGRSL